MFDLYTALTIGLIGSMHCIGMCGPIAVALPLGDQGWLFKVTRALTYNIGRTVTYGLMGAVFGLVGRGIQLAGFQQWASIGIGVFMILSAIFPFMFRGKLPLDSMFKGYALRMIDGFKTLFRKQSHYNLFVIGILNGLLPCGLVYVAVAGALNTHDVMMGILFMIAFGLGTLPVMTLIPLARQIFSKAFRTKVNRIIPAFVVMLGILFILRGMSLGIPYVSPKTDKLNPKKEIKVEGSCCSPGT